LLLLHNTCLRQVRHILGFQQLCIFFYLLYRTKIARAFHHLTGLLRNNKCVINNIRA